MLLKYFILCAALAVFVQADAACDASVQRDGKPTYILGNDGTIFDNDSGLTWKVCSVGQQWQPDGSCAGEATLMNFNEAKAAAQGEWRLPNLKEWGYLVWRCIPNEKAQNYFPIRRGDLFWSSTMLYDRMEISSTKLRPSVVDYFARGPRTPGWDVKVKVLLVKGTEIPFID